MLISVCLVLSGGVKPDRLPKMMMMMKSRSLMANNISKSYVKKNDIINYVTNFCSIRCYFSSFYQIAKSFLRIVDLHNSSFRFLPSFFIKVEVCKNSDCFQTGFLSSSTEQKTC